MPLSPSLPESSSGCVINVLALGSDEPKESCVGTYTLASTWASPLRVGSQCSLVMGKELRLLSWESVRWG